MNKRLDIDLGARSYPIFIGPGLLHEPVVLRSFIRARQVMVVSNTTVAPLYLEPLRAGLSGLQVAECILPDGEAYKEINTWHGVFDALLTQRFARDCTLIALGGGVVGDITGFAAACYQRGVSFIQVPTTLLAQVDSSVGGKTGINHPAGKNMIGAFHQPVAVVADTDTLTTLPERELAAGLAEVVKYGLIRDAAFFDWLEVHAEALRNRNAAALIEAIERSCHNKAVVVEADEHELGQRALLNLGHTFGHAIEAGLGYGSWLHGEAVAAGMVMAAQLSCLLGWLDAASVQRIRALLAHFGLPVAPPDQLSSQAMLEHMAVDKKVLAGVPRLVLLKGIGNALVTGEVSTGQMIASIEASRHQPSSG